MKGIGHLLGSFYNSIQFNGRMVITHILWQVCLDIAGPILFHFQTNSWASCILQSVCLWRWGSNLHSFALWYLVGIGQVLRSLSFAVSRFTSRLPRREYDWAMPPGSFIVDGCPGTNCSSEYPPILWRSQGTWKLLIREEWLDIIAPDVSRAVVLVTLVDVEGRELLGDDLSLYVQIWKTYEK